jgi:L-asparaginase/Glu-tRNA(Gln) amidotransferase subunit D
MGILVVTTGGTIGSLPYEDPPHPPKYSKMPDAGIDFVRDALKCEPFCRVENRCISFEPRDSKNIDAEYLARLSKLIGNADETHILVAHGTDGILQSAEYFFQHTDLKDKSVVLTGAMVPLANGSISDGYRNIEFSMSQLSRPDIGPGIFIVLCGFEDMNSDNGAWAPRLYPYQPHTYEKYYASDVLYSRLRRIQS